MVNLQIILIVSKQISTSKPFTATCKSSILLMVLIAFDHFYPSDNNGCPQQNATPASNSAILQRKVFLQTASSHYQNK